MVNFYVLQIKLGKITLEEVPKRWQSAVADSWHEITEEEYTQAIAEQGGD